MIDKADRARLRGALLKDGMINAGWDEATLADIQAITHGLDPAKVIIEANSLCVIVRVKPAPRPTTS